MLSRRHFLGALAAPALAQKKRPVAASDRPNVLLILADDLGAWMLGCYGNKEIHTPNIDRLAQTGMRFINCLVCTPVSSAARATLFTGRLPRQNGLLDFLTSNPTGNPPQGQSAPPASFSKEIMISDILAGEGYNCGYAGEWRMGNDAQMQHGFKFWNTAAASAETVTAQAGQFLDQQSAGKPFFLTAGYTNPHPPYDTLSQKHLEMYAGVKFDSFNYEPMARNAARDKEMFKDFLGNARKCAAATTALDEQVAALIEKVRQRRLLDNTLVIFTSDTGLLLGQHGLWGRGLASDPINMYEQAIAVPMIWSWLGKIPPTNSRPELVSSYDLLPTLCEATGSAQPTGRDLCGRSYLPLALGQKMPKKEPWRNLVFGEYRNTEMVRDPRYKLVVRDGGKGPNEFFDLTADPRERVNQYDNPQYVSMRDRLAGELAGRRKKYSV
jgi:arylsulfatase A-like enzyme